MKWITRERPKIDRIACPWLIARFVDPEAEFLYVPRDEVLYLKAELKYLTVRTATRSLSVATPVTGFLARAKPWTSDHMLGTLT